MTNPTKQPSDAWDWNQNRQHLGLSVLRRLYQYSTPYARQRNCLLLLVIVRAVQIGVMGWMIGAIINGPIADGRISGLILAVTGFLAFALFTQTVLRFRLNLAMRFGESVIHDLRRELFDHLIRMPVSFFHRIPAGRIISRITSDVQAIRVGVQDVLFVSMVELGQMLTVAIMMLFIDPLLFLVLACIAPLILLINRIFHKRLGNAHREVQESFSRLSSTLVESVHGIRESQGFVRDDINNLRFEQIVRNHARTNMRVTRTSGIFLPLLDLSNQLFLGLLILVGGYRVLHPEIDAPVSDLIQFIFLASIFFAPFRTLGNQYDHALNAMAGAERMFRLLDTKPEWADPPDARILPPIQGRVEFKNVSFSYQAGRPILHDISFTARPGQRIALVGHTGSGKSSVINLLAKFYLPDSGRILVDGLDLANHSSASLHQQLGLVTQTHHLFSGTVWENLRLGNPTATEKDIREATEKLGCESFLSSLPNGLQTQIREKGAGLSLGQRQMVSLIRAMVADPRILLLDEATSAMDTITEMRLQEVMNRLMAGRTTFIVAHRLSTVRQADLLLVMDQGRIVERGTHSRLLERNGIYSRLYAEFWGGRRSRV